MNEINNFNDYYITKEGEVFSFKTGSLVQLKPYMCTNRYVAIKLMSNDGERKACLIHRLVASAFIPNPNGYSEVNHLDGDISNNHVENLEWTTRRDNIRYNYTHLNQTPIKNYVPCMLINTDGDTIHNFNSLKDACEYASKYLGVSYSSMMKYKHSNNIKLIIEEKCNDYPVAGSTVENELPLEVLCPCLFQ